VQFFVYHSLGKKVLRLVAKNIVLVLVLKQESPANANENARQRCMFAGPLRTKSKLTDPSNLDMMTFIHLFTYARWRHRSHAACVVRVAESPHFKKGT